MPVKIFLRNLFLISLVLNSENNSVASLNSQQNVLFPPATKIILLQIFFLDTGRAQW